MNSEIIILENQVLIMEGLLSTFWDSMRGIYTTDADYIDRLKNQIVFTKARIKGLN